MARDFAAFFIFLAWREQVLAKREQVLAKREQESPKREQVLARRELGPTTLSPAKLPDGVEKQRKNRDEVGKG